MPQFELTPGEDMLWHADWAASDHQDACVVAAEDEDHARRLAARRFRSRLVPDFFGDPWLRADLVAVRQMTVRQGPELPLGMVIPIMPWVVS